MYCRPHVFHKLSPIVPWESLTFPCSLSFLSFLSFPQKIFLDSLLAINLESVVSGFILLITLKLYDENALTRAHRLLA